MTIRGSSVVSRRHLYYGVPFSSFSLASVNGNKSHILVHKKTFPFLLSCTTSPFTGCTKSNKLNAPLSQASSSSSFFSSFSSTERMTTIVPTLASSTIANQIHTRKLYGRSNRDVLCHSSSSSSSSSTSSSFSSSSNNDKTSDTTITIYQYSICPFCNRVKALLDYSKVPYNVVEVNPLTKYEIKSWSKSYTKVPIVTIDIKNKEEHDFHNNNDAKQRQVIFGSDDIIQSLLENEIVLSKLQQKWNSSSTVSLLSSSSLPSYDENKMTMEDFIRPVLIETTYNNNTHSNNENNNTSTTTTNRSWSNFAVDDLASLLYPNICRTWKDSYNAFSYVHTISSFTTIQKISIQCIGSLAMYMAASRVKKKRNIVDERKALEDALLTFGHSVLLKNNNSKNYFLSQKSEPNMDDITVFGILRSIEGFPVHNEIMKYNDTNNNTNSDIQSELLSHEEKEEGLRRVSDWYKHMTQKMSEG